MDIYFNQGCCVAFLVGYFVMGTFFSAMIRQDIDVMLRISTGVVGALIFGFLFGAINRRSKNA